MPEALDLITKQGALPSLILFSLFWNGDIWISKDGARMLYAYISESWNRDNQSRVQQFLDSAVRRHFSAEAGLMSGGLMAFTLSGSLLALLLGLSLAGKVAKFGFRTVVPPSRMISQFHCASYSRVISDFFESALSMVNVYPAP